MASRNVAFFVDRAREVTLTCGGEEQLGPCGGKPAGTVLTGIPGRAWRSDAAAIFSFDDYRATLMRYWSGELPSVRDQYGDGSLRLHVLAYSGGEDPPAFRAVVTSITDVYPSTGYPIGHSEREAHIFNFIHDGSGWAFTGEIVAPMTVTAEDWLSGECAECYDYWETWHED